MPKLLSPKGLGREEESTCDHERAPAAGAGTRFSGAFPRAVGATNDETTAGTEGCIGEATRRGRKRAGDDGVSLIIRERREEGEKV